METFVVRVFVPAEAGSVPFCGVVEVSSSGRAESFRSAHDLIQIVLHELELGRTAAEPAEPEGEDTT